ISVFVRPTLLMARTSRIWNARASDGTKYGLRDSGGIERELNTYQPIDNVTAAALDDRIEGFSSERYMRGVSGKLILLSAVAVVAGAQSLPPAAQRLVDFARDVAPVLAVCQGCHGAHQQMSGLRLDSRKAALAGGKSGPALEPGNSAHSRVIRLVAGVEKIVMPPGGARLTAEQVGILRAWIDQGA